MRKAKAESETSEFEMQPEYDFRGGQRGKFAKAYQQGHQVEVHQADGTVIVQHFAPDKNSVVLDPDVLEYFPDSDSVNRALRSLIALIPRVRQHKARRRRNR